MIQHVVPIIHILGENRTYESVLGDVPARQRGGQTRCGVRAKIAERAQLIKRFPTLRQLLRPSRQSADGTSGISSPAPLCRTTSSRLETGCAANPGGNSRLWPRDIKKAPPLSRSGSRWLPVKIYANTSIHDTFQTPKRATPEPTWIRFNLTRNLARLGPRRPLYYQNTGSGTILCPAGSNPTSSRLPAVRSGIFPTIRGGGRSVLQDFRNDPRRYGPALSILWVMDDHNRARHDCGRRPADGR